MDRVWKSGASATPPTYPGASAAYPTEGVPGSIAPTLPGAWWFYMMTEELRNLILFCGGVTNGNGTHDLQNAISAYVNSFASTFIEGPNGREYYADNWVQQWIEHDVIAGAVPANFTVTYPTAFAVVSNIPRVTIFDATFPLSGTLIATISSYSLSGCVVNVGRDGGGTTRDFTICIDVRGH